MGIRISREGDEFVSINHFTYYYSSGDALCWVRCHVSLSLPGGVSLPLEAIDPRRPFVGILDASQRVDSQVRVSSLKPRQVLYLGISRALLFAALDRELPRLSFRENKAVHTLRVKIDTFVGSGGSPTVSRQLQVDTRADLEVETGLKDAPLPDASQRLIPVSIPKLRRDDRSFSRNDLAAACEPGGAASSGTIHIEINQGAPQRFAREALFAFKVAPCLGVGEREVYPFVFACLSVTGLETIDTSPLRKIFLCTATDVPADQTTDTALDQTMNGLAVATMEESGWELSRSPALTEITGSEAGQTHAMIYRLSVVQNYALCIQLSELEFEIERLFSGERDRLTLELVLFQSEQLVEPLETHQLELKMIRSEQRLVLVSSESEHRAAVIDVDQASGEAPPDPGLISLLERSPDRYKTGIITGIVRNLSREQVECQVTSRTASDYITFSAGAARSFDLTLIEGRAYIRIGNAKVDVEVLPPAEAKVIALDIGTMAISMATGSVVSGEISPVDLGSMVAQSVPPNQRRREAGYNELMSSACGITVSAGPVRFVLPAQCVGKTPRDRRLDAWRTLGPNRHKDDLEARLKLTKAPLEIHLPLYDRGHEALSDLRIQGRGFASIQSVKTQICTYSSLKVSSGLSTLVAPLTEPHTLSERPLKEVETEALLAASLDALLFVYSPAGIDDPEARRRDWDFVLTYPASIGATARLRYYDALKYLVDRQQREFDRNMQKLPGKHGRIRLRLVPESVAACWALVNSNNLAPNQAGKLRRLVLFDIGAGTFDVNSMEILRDKNDDIVSQTVCFSVPLGGDVLDRAIARDYLRNPEFRRHDDKGDDDPDLLSRIEAGKRVRELQPRYLPIPMKRGEAGIELDKNDKLNGWQGPPDVLQFCNDPNRNYRIEWAIIDLEDRSEMNAWLQAYLRVVTKLIVEPTLRASGQYDETFVDVDVVISGRAGFFTPLRAAIQEGVNSTWPKRKTTVKLASDVLSGRSTSFSVPSLEDVHRMKGLVARGAALWSRNASLRDETKTIEQPPRAIHALASFAVVIGIWDDARCGFFPIKELKDIQIGQMKFKLDEVLEHQGQFENLYAFIATRPPFMNIHALHAALGKTEDEIAGDFAREFINRCLRPIVLKALPDPSIASVGSPLPYPYAGFPPDLHDAIFESICFAAGPEQTVVLDCSVVGDGKIYLHVAVDGENFGNWTLSSTFMIQDPWP